MLANAHANSELKSVMSIKHFRQHSDRNFEHLLEVESKIKSVIDKAIGFASQTGGAASVGMLKSKLASINDSIEAIKQILRDGKKKIEISDRSDNSGMWIETDALSNQLENELGDIARMGSEMLPPNENVDWQKEMRDAKGVLLPFLVAYARKRR